MIRKIIVIGCCTVIMSFYTSNALAAESYYVWLDEDGVVNFSSEKPVGVDAELVSEEQRFGIPRRKAQEENSSLPTNSDSKMGSSREDIASELENNMAIRNIKKEAEVSRRKACESARVNQKRFQERGRIRLKASDGSYTIMTDDEKRQRQDAFRKTISENCTNKR